MNPIEYPMLKTPTIRSFSPFENLVLKSKSLAERSNVISTFIPAKTPPLPGRGVYAGSNGDATIKEIVSQISQSKDYCLFVLIACAESADADGYFSLSKEAVKYMAKVSYCNLSQFHHCFRKLVQDFKDLEAPFFMQEPVMTTREHPKKLAKAYLRDDHQGRLAPKINGKLRVRFNIVDHLGPKGK